MRIMLCHVRVRVIGCNATFNNILAILWQLVLFVDETGENHRPVASPEQSSTHNVVSGTLCHEQVLNSQL